MRPPRRLALWAAALGVAVYAAAAQADAGVKCTLSFTLRGWSAFYQTATGTGTVRCDNGQTLRVKLSAKGGGLTVGKSVEGGHGEFSSVSSIAEVLGAYAAAEAHAGAIKSAQVQVLTKGEVSLALSGKGRGWELGISFGELKIEH